MERNARCLCGSGKKHKHCCGRAATGRDRDETMWPVPRHQKESLGPIVETIERVFELYNDFVVKEPRFLSDLAWELQLRVQVFTEDVNLSTLHHYVVFGSARLMESHDALVSYVRGHLEGREAEVFDLFEGRPLELVELKNDDEVISAFSGKSMHGGRSPLGVSCFVTGETIPIGTSLWAGWRVGPELATFVFAGRLTPEQWDFIEDLVDPNFEGLADYDAEENICEVLQIFAAPLDDYGSWSVDGDEDEYGYGYEWVQSPEAMEKERRFFQAQYRKDFDDFDPKAHRELIRKIFGLHLRTSWSGTTHILGHTELRATLAREESLRMVRVVDAHLSDLRLSLLALKPQMFCEVDNQETLDKLLPISALRRSVGLEADGSMPRASAALLALEPMTLLQLPMQHPVFDSVDAEDPISRALAWARQRDDELGRQVAVAFQQMVCERRWCATWVDEDGVPPPFYKMHYDETMSALAQLFDARAREAPLSSLELDDVVQRRLQSHLGVQAHLANLPKAQDEVLKMKGVGSKTLELLTLALQKWMTQWRCVGSRTSSKGVVRSLEAVSTLSDGLSELAGLFEGKE